MKQVIFSLVIALSVHTLSAQSLDSLGAIERQQEQLRVEQLKLQARQDSLQRVQQRLQLNAEQAKPKQEVAQTTSKEHYNHTVIAWHPIFSMLQQIHFSLEQAVSKSSSVYLELAYHDFNLRENSTMESLTPGNWTAYSGYRAELQWRYYILPESRALYQLYVAPHFFYKQDEITRGEGTHYSTYNGDDKRYEYYNQYLAQAVGGGFNIGYQIQFLRHLTFDSSVGASYISPVSDKQWSDMAHLSLINPYKNGMSLRMNLSVGFAF